MSTHPNVILMAVLTPDDLSRKTMRSILDEHCANDTFDLDKITIDSKEYHTVIMESDYDDGWQIAANEGDLVFFDLVTYGYGDVIKWNDLETKRQSLEKWAIDVCEKYHCSYSIQVTANYW